MGLFQEPCLAESCPMWFTIPDDYDTPLGLGNIVINIGDCYE